METINLTKAEKHYLKAVFNEKKCEVEDLLSSIESNLKPALCKELNTLDGLIEKMEAAN